MKRVNEWVMGHMRDKMGEDEKDVNLRGLLDLLFATTVRVSPNPKIFTSVCRAVHEKLGTLNQTTVAEDSGRGRYTSTKKYLFKYSPFSEDKTILDDHVDFTNLEKESNLRNC